jgi:HKD family nuclease
MSSKRLAFEVIENSGPNNLRDVLKAKLGKASKVSIAVAFVTESGLNDIIQPLRQVAVHGEVQLVTGLYQRITEPKALKTLLRIQDETGGKFSVRLSKETQFHRKVFLLENRTQATAIIGSSNLTREGMQSSGELDLMVSLPPQCPLFRRLKAALEKCCDRAVPLTLEQIERYESVRPEPVRQQGYTKGQLRKILGTEPSKEEPTNVWRTSINGFVRPRTEQIISETTNWDDNGFDWFSTGRIHHYHNADRIFLFDFARKRLSLVKVRDMTRTAIPTPDGRHFVAFTQVRGYSRRFSNKLWEQLEHEGIRKKDAKNTRKVSTATELRLKSILHPKR